MFIKISMRVQYNPKYLTDETGTSACPKNDTLMSQVFLTCVKSCLVRNTMSLVLLGLIRS